MLARYDGEIILADKRYGKVCDLTRNPERTLLSKGRRVT